MDSGVYVSSSNLSKSKPATVTVKKYKKSKTRYAKTKNVKVYKYPSTAKTSTVKVKLSKGTKVTVKGVATKYKGKDVKGTWYKCKVKVAGKSYTGYIHRDNLTTTKPKNNSSSGNHTNSVPDDFGDMDKASDRGSNIQG